MSTMGRWTVLVGCALAGLLVAIALWFGTRPDNELVSSESTEIAPYLSVRLGHVADPAPGTVGTTDPEHRRVAVTVVLAGKPEWASSLIPRCVPAEDGSGARYEAISVERSSTGYPPEVTFVYEVPAAATGLRLRWTCWDGSGGERIYTPLS